MKSADIRLSFLNFFKSKGHTIVPSTSLRPTAPNLLFTNAGMNAFVPNFLGEQEAPHKRIADTQKCIRAGGKHNDLKDVGFDTSHHTFFEMLGNWSFGDYFKKEAIEWAWELLTKVWEIPKERIYVTVYKPEKGEPAEFDQEAYDYWKSIFKAEGMDPDIHICTGGEKENFWMMGETGPCGPSSEIHIDLTEQGNTLGKLVNTDSPYCVELWNLVFIQFNAQVNGDFTPLASRHVDTGMGFERAAGIFATTKNFSDFSRPPSNYDSDLFTDIFNQLTHLTGHHYRSTIPEDRNKLSDMEMRDCAFRVICDHIRTLTFSIADGIIPGNEGRNYVLRRILRRALLFANRIELPHRSLVILAELLIDKFKDIFPELSEQKEIILKCIDAEEETFEITLDRGLQHFEKMTSGKKKTVSGKDAFKLFDTYGFPIDLTQIIARERGIKIDLVGFNREMEKQRERARAAQNKTVITVQENKTIAANETKFVGYEKANLQDFKAEIKDIVFEGDDCFLIFDQTPFYAQMGGQIGDSGHATIKGDRFPILDTLKDESNHYLHKTKLSGSGEWVGKSVLLSVDGERHSAIQRHHSGTHLLHWALREILGSHVHQSGSFVGDDYLRFDFNHFEQTQKIQLRAIEKIINARILEDTAITTYEVPLAEKPDAVLAFFGDKYGAIVRVVDIGGYSKELCAGTHVERTGEIGPLKIVSETAIASGTRRIEAVVGTSALDLMNHDFDLLQEMAQKLSCSPDELVERFESIISQRYELEKQLRNQQEKGTAQLAEKLAGQAKIHSGLNWVIAKVNAANTEELRSLAISTAEILGPVAVVLGSIINKKVTLLVLCSEDAVNSGHHAGHIVGEISGKLDGKGGGKPDFAMGGGKNPDKLEAVLNAFNESLG